jgi:AraC-like DNA-binding protein
VVVASDQRRPGGEAVLERMSEMLFVEVLRRYADSLPPEQTGWLAAMRDPAVGRALALLHENPAQAWTLERLGEDAGLSRSSLHERFVHFIGQPPMQYLTQWRMQVARPSARTRSRRSRSGSHESEALPAGVKEVGVSPGAWRRRRRRSAGASTRDLRAKE